MPVFFERRGQVAGAVSWHKRPNVMPGKAIRLCGPGWLPDSLINDGWIPSIVTAGSGRWLARQMGVVPYRGPAEGVISRGNPNEDRRGYHYAHAG